MRGREEPDSGPRPHPAGPADEAGPSRHPDHDDTRHGTTTLFAALHVLTGTVIGECHGRHPHQEFLKFLRRLDRAFPRDLTLHVILDNYGSHKHATVRTWLAAHPRFTQHFTPTGASWLNLVESWFSKLTQQRKVPRR